jgi:tRNA G46 methylase TrmB
MQSMKAETLSPAFFSRPVKSSQAAVHPRLEAVVEKHRLKRWLQPYHPPSIDAFERVVKLIAGSDMPLVLDSGCGTGESTRLIARSLPDCLVIGVDKSLKRLQRGRAPASPQYEGNVIMLRADLTTFWRLALAAGWRLHRHYLLYPNPWPKPGQLQRRWHAHPVFPSMLALGGRLEMRSNWKIYALEFAAAANRLLGTRSEPRNVSPGTISSPFERKYRGSGHRLYSVVVSADSSRVK